MVDKNLILFLYTSIVICFAQMSHRTWRFMPRQELYRKREREWEIKTFIVRLAYSIRAHAIWCIAFCENIDLRQVIQPRPHNQDDFCAIISVSLSHQRIRSELRIIGCVKNDFNRQSIQTVWEWIVFRLTWSKGKWSRTIDGKWTCITNLHIQLLIQLHTKYVFSIRCEFSALRNVRMKKLYAWQIEVFALLLFYVISIVIHASKILSS